MNPLPNYAKVVFENAIEIDDSEDRSAYIDQQCANDRSLRRKVAGLLHAYDCAGSFLEMTAIDSDDLSLALERVATAEGRIADGHNALPQLAGNVQRLRMEIEQRRQQQQHFQRFQRMARDAQDAMLYDKDKELQEDQLALQTLALYGVLQDDRWIDRLRLLNVGDANFAAGLAGYQSFAGELVAGFQSGIRFLKRQQGRVSTESGKTIPHMIASCHKAATALASFAKTALPATDGDTADRRDTLVQQLTDTRAAVSELLTWLSK